MADTAQDVGAVTGLAVAGAHVGVELGLLATVGPVPIIGALVGIGVGVYELAKALGIGKGCGNSCIIGAEWEQAYEVAGEDFIQFILHGLISKSDGLAIIDEIRQAGADAIESLTNISEDRKQKTIRNLRKSMTYDSSSWVGVADGRTPESLQTAGSTGKWYQASVQKGHQLALALLEQATPVLGSVRYTGAPGPYTRQVMQQGSGILASLGGTLDNLGGPNCSVCKPVLYLAIGFFAAKALKLI